MTAHFASYSYSEGKQVPYAWHILGTDASDQKTVRYRFDMSGKHLPLGEPSSNRIEIAPVQERPAPLYDLNVGLKPAVPDENNYEEPVLTYSVSINMNWSGRRVGTMEFTIGCFTESNHLFNLDKTWGFSVQPSHYMALVGPPVVKYLIGRSGDYNRVIVQLAQSAIFLGNLPEIQLRVTPRLVYYPNDQPSPPEPRWFARGVCKLSAYLISTTKPVETYRVYHRPE